MKKMLAFVLLFTVAFRSFAADPGVDERVLLAFRQSFPDVRDERWSESTDAYQVSFSKDEIRSTITYDKEGNMLKTFRYYDEKHLPVLLLSTLKKKYPNKTVFGVTEESSEDGITYHITLEDEKYWTKVKADNFGAMSVEQKLRKG